MGEKSSKCTASQLGWELQNSHTPFEGKLFRIREDRLALPRGKTLTYQYEERAPGIVVVPVTPAGEIVLIQQYRYPVDTWCLETPAGGCHDTGDMSLEQVVAKELHEEIGAEVDRVEHLGCFFSSPSFTDERCHAFLAWGTRFTARPDREKGEVIENLVVPAQEAFRLARTGEIKTAACLVALLWAEVRLRESGLITG